MQRTPVLRRLFPLAALALLAACSDAPTAPAAPSSDADPVLEAVNRQLAGAATVLRIERTLQGTELDGPSLTLRSAEARAAAGAPKASFDPWPPFYCWSPSDSSWCPQIYIGAAVWGWGVPGKATLYAHLDVMENAASSELNVSLGAVGGCSGSGGTFAYRYLSGGSDTPYALIVSETHEFTGGQVRWSVSASGSAVAPWGTFIDAWASASACH